MAMESMLNMRATIERASPQISAAGDVSLEWFEVSSDVPCMVQEKQVRERLSPIGEIVETRAVAYFSDGVDLRPGAGDDASDRITVGGKSWRVVGVTKSPGPKDCMLIADLER